MLLKNTDAVQSVKIVLLLSLNTMMNVALKTHKELYKAKIWAA